MGEIELGASMRLQFRVTDDDTAIALGSGELPVLATPRAIAWVEAASTRAVAEFLQPADTTVGARVDVVHRRPTPVGSDVMVEATVAGVDGRRIDYEVRMTNPDGTTAMTGSLTRVIVERETFV